MGRCIFTGVELSVGEELDVVRRIFRRDMVAFGSVSLNLQRHQDDQP